MCQKHASVHFWSFLAPAVSEYGAAATFCFCQCVRLCGARCSECESLDCLTLAQFGLINVFPARNNARRQKIAKFLSWAYPELKNRKFSHFDPMRLRGSISTSTIHFTISKPVSAVRADATEVPLPKKNPLAQTV